MVISSRTPEGLPNHCPICGKEVRLEPTVNIANTADAPCPHCGSLLWFDAGAEVGMHPTFTEAKRKSQYLIDGLLRLSQTATNANAYYQGMLSCLVTALAAQGGAVWTGGIRNPRLQYGLGIGLRGITEPLLWEPAHRGLLKRVFFEGIPTAIPPNPHPPSVEHNGNPTESLLLLSPIKKNFETVALVEVFQRTGGNATVQRGYLRFLLQTCAMAEQCPAIRGGN